MGNELPKSTLPSKEDIFKLFKGDIYRQSSLYANTTLISSKDQDKKTIEDEINHIKDIKLSRALSSLICSALGDSLGCNTEFSEFSYDDPPFNIKDFNELKNFEFKRASIGQWTDDTSMALCLADSILRKKGEFDGIDIRYRFLLWWHYGYNNGREKEPSFGLGGNISESFSNFYLNPNSEFMIKTELNQHNNGNGSLMRLAPVPIYFHDNEMKGLEYAEKQSCTTHTGTEAAECCRLLTFLIIRLINRDENKDFRVIFDEMKNFISPCLSVIKMACSEKETDFPKDGFNQNNDDRDWNWKNEKYNFSKTRWSQNPGYFGSYCMDALALSLHYAYHSKNPKETILRVINAGGDSDTVGAITGQIVGAIYGLVPDILELYKQGIVQWDDYAIATTAYKLFYHKNN